MNKKTKVLLILFLLIILVIIICLNVLKKEKIEIIFNSSGGSTVESIIIEKGTPFKIMAFPTREGYKFVGWVDKYGNQVFEGAIFDSEKITLYAKWEKEEENIDLDIKEDDKIVEDAQNKDGPVKEPIKESVKEYYCSKDYTLNGTKCIKTITKNATVKNVCPKGYADWGKNMCFDESSKVVPDYMVCPDGTVRDGLSERCYTEPLEYDKSKCESLSLYWYLGVCYSNWKSVTCKNGESITVSANSTDPSDKSVTFYCGGKYKTGTNQYICPKDYTLKGSKCYKTETINASVRYK